jgi:phosphate acyltransferase
MIKIAVDAMGGDNAPQALIEGAYIALEEFDNIEIQLYGKQEAMAPFLKDHARLTVVQCEEVVEMNDDPARAVRRKKDSSMARMLEAVTNGEADACLSAGSTGALMAGGLFKVGRIEGVARPALATTLPTLNGDGFLMLDLGANADAKPEYLQQYAIMGDIYAKKVRGLSSPRVGLLNIGTEEKKGNDLTKGAFELISSTDFNFVGNIEAREILNGVSDVVVTDGFTGNMILKTIEGTAGAMFSMLKDAFTANVKSKVAYVLVKDGLKNIKNTLDYSEYGGACLFGLKAPVIKAHGSSNARAVFSAIRQARLMVEHDVCQTIAETIAKNNASNEVATEAQPISE